ncbi:hypothetical protein ES703_30812 [subsurface metagenome]
MADKHRLICTRTLADSEVGQLRRRFITPAYTIGYDNTVEIYFTDGRHRSPNYPLMVGTTHALANGRRLID